jgi:hypothetical protein
MICLFNNLFLHLRRKKYLLYDTTQKNINMNSVHHLQISDEQAMINCVKYFPNVTEITISQESIIENENLSLSATLNHICPLLKQLEKLNITHYYGCFSDIIEFIRCTPDIHTFEIGYIYHSMI